MSDVPALVAAVLTGLYLWRRNPASCPGVCGWARCVRLPIAVAKLAGNGISEVTVYKRMVATRKWENHSVRCATHLSETQMRIHSLHFRSPLAGRRGPAPTPADRTEQTATWFDTRERQWPDSVRAARRTRREAVLRGSLHPRSAQKVERVATLDVPNGFWNGSMSTMPDGTPLLLRDLEVEEIYTRRQPPVKPCLQPHRQAQRHVQQMKRKVSCRVKSCRRQAGKGFAKSE